MVNENSMSRLNKLINAFGNLPAIAEGIKNKVFTKDDVEQIADIRWSICDRCEFIDRKGGSLCNARYSSLLC